MTFKSLAQKNWANSPEGISTLGHEKVQQWNQASNGLDLPERSQAPKSKKKEKQKQKPKRLSSGIRWA